MKPNIMKQYVFIILVFALLGSCKENKREKVENNESLRAKELFQGIWIDDDNDMILFKVKEDTIYYADSQNIPVAFKIKKDSLFMYGNESSIYHIDKQTEHVFWFHSLAGDIIKLHKSENLEDSLAFSDRALRPIPIYTEVTKKDTVVMYKGTRYRAYVYINPSKMKVIKTSYSEDGISVDNVYYDNIMHVCIYEGRKSLFSKDIAKQDFKSVVPAEFLQKSILSDMEFSGIDINGYHYLATICIPESSIYYLINLNINFEGELLFSPVK